MAVVFKDFIATSTALIRSSAEPRQPQGGCTLDIKYYEGKNLNWKPLLKQIKEDPDEWLESGGGSSPTRSTTTKARMARAQVRMD